MNTEAAPAPKLLKARMRHTRLFMLLLFPLVLVSHTMVDADTFLHEGMEGFGTLLVLVCIFGRIYSTAFIGGRKNDEVVANGPFSVVRNPLYCFSFIGVLGIGMQSGSLLFFALLVAAFMVYYPGVVKREEAFLLHRFGEAYAKYCREVPRWIPRFSLWRASETVEVRPKFLVNAMLDGVMFFLPLFMFELVEELQAVGTLPQLMMVP